MSCGGAGVPSGASTGRFEAVELRDREKRYRGMGVRLAAEHVNARIAPEIIGMNVFDQAALDGVLVRLDGTPDKSNLGANAMLGVSMAAARSASAALAMPLYSYLGGTNAKRLPVPMMNVINGGRHADNTIDIQEFMILPVGADCFREGLRMCAEVYHGLKGLLKERGHATSVGDEGGFAPDLGNAKEALTILAEAIRRTGLQPGKDVALALDAAASELYDPDLQKYVFEGNRSAEEMIDYYEELAETFPIVSIEDPLDEEDWEGWELITTRMGQNIQLVGDDLFVTNKKRLERGIQKGVGNAILIKVNQIGTLTEAFDAIELAKNAGYHAIISHRSGETADGIIADIAVAFNAGQIKAGAPCRSERTEKYNQLLRIEERLGDAAEYEDPFL